VNECDFTETCDGAVSACPSDLVRVVCCDEDADCDDGNPCTRDTCLGGTACGHAAVPGCCMSADDCDDGDRCTRDACDPATHACIRTPTCDAGTDGGDGGDRPDARSDGGAGGPPPGGCDCGIAGAHPRASAGLPLLVAVLLGVVVRRRR
jgi:MYXO-CTERM domain-containing protein